MAAQNKAITDAGFTDVADVIAQHQALVAPVSLALTTGTDSLVGGAGNDNFTSAAGTLTTADAVIDSSTVDSDTLTINNTGSTTTAGTTIAGIENVVFNITSFATPTITTSGIGAGTEVTVNQLQLGSTGALTVSGVAYDMNLTAGSNITGTLSMNTITAGSTITINAGSAATVTTTTAGALGVMNITGGSLLGTTTSIASAQVITTTNASSTLNIDGVGTVAGDTATLNIGAAASIATGAANAVEAITVSSSFVKTATATATATVTTAAADTYTITGSNDVILAGDEAMFDGKIVTDTSSAASTLKLTVVADSDLSKAAVDTIDLSAAAAGAVALSFNDNANVSLSADVGGILTINADDDGATSYLKGNLTLSLDADVDAFAVTLPASGATSDGFDNIALVVNVDNTTAGGGFDLITGTGVVTASGAKELFLAATSTAKSFDASAMTGKVTVNYDNVNDIVTATTGSGADAITVATASTTKATVKTMGGNDTITTLSTSVMDINGGEGYDIVNVVGDMTGLTLALVEEIATTGDVTGAKASQLSGQATIMSGANAFTFGTAAANFDNEVINLGTLNINGVTGFTADVSNGLSTALYTSATGVALTGTSVADTLKGTANADTITGGAGLDTIVGNAGSDTIFGGAGGDIIHADGGGTKESSVVTITFNGAGADVFTIAGTAVSVASTVDAATTATAAISAINLVAALDDVVLASSGGAGVVTITSLVDGNFGDAVLTSSAGGNTVAIVTTDGTRGTSATDTVSGADGATAAADIHLVSSGNAGAIISATKFDTITDFGATDVVNYTENVMTIVNGSVSTTAGTAAVTAAGIATFNAADDTLAEKIVATEAGINASGAAAQGQVAAFMHGSDAYVFISDGTDGVDINDSMLMLTGVDLTATATDTITLAGGDFTIA